MRRRVSVVLTLTLAAVSGFTVLTGSAVAAAVGGSPGHAGGGPAAGLTPPPLPPPMLTADARFEAARFTAEPSG